MTSRFFRAAVLALAVGVAPAAAWAQETNELDILLQQQLLLKKKQQGKEMQLPAEQGPAPEVTPLPQGETPEPQREIVEQPPEISPLPQGEVPEQKPRRKKPGREVVEQPAPGPDLAGPSAIQIERQLEARPRIQLAPEDRVTIREFKRRPDLRRAAPSIDIQAINFEFGSAEIPFSQFRKVENIATAMERLLDRDPDTQILIEGHTDAIGSFGSNQRLSEQRAASLKRVLVREFGIPSYAMETVGYGEEYLLVPTSREEWRNRRVTLRSIDDFIR